MAARRGQVFNLRRYLSATFITDPRLARTQAALGSIAPICINSSQSPPLKTNITELDSNFPPRNTKLKLREDTLKIYF